MSHQPYPQQNRTDADVQVVAVVLAWAATLLTFFYMLPWAIAATRGKSNQWAIALLNLLVGWTIIGWLVALVMACTPHQQRAVPAHPQQPAAPRRPGGTRHRPAAGSATGTAPAGPSTSRRSGRRTEPA